MKQQRTIELLAPAANYEVAVAAIDAGADAIYIGAGRFSARSAAANSTADIEKLCQYAQPFGVKIYVALNTLLYSDNELAEAESLAREVVNAGVAGIIFQDVRLLDMDLPTEMHASTQTWQHSVERAKSFEAAGVSRIVLERGLSISEIRAISEATDVELEVFVHGAICVGQSGVCYLSEYLAGRSGNRGECAQPCRSRYNLIDGKGNIVIRDEALLSPRDLNLSRRIGELIDAGVKSLKIEGRLKDKDYVTNVVAYYNNLLNAMGISRSSWGRAVASFEPNLRLTFNRGFTEWFFDGVTKEQRLSNTAAVAGEFIGSIKEVERDYIEVRLESGIEISNGDGLSYRDAELRVQGVRVNRAMGGRLFMLKTEGLEVGMKLYRNSKMGWQPTSVRKIEVSVEFKEVDGGYALLAVDEVDRRAEVMIDMADTEEAKDSARSCESISSAMRKSGGTIFSVVSVEVDCQRVPFMAASRLNGLRRELLEKLEAAGRASEARVFGKTTSSGVDNPQPSDLMITRYCILREKGLCLKESKLPQPLYLLNNHVKVGLRFDCGKCEMHLYRME